MLARMPVAVDHPAVREQVRLLYIGNGGNLTLAAKTAGIPVDRAEKWKERGKWDELNDAATRQMSLSENVGKVADNLARTLADDSAQSRVGFSKAARKVATHLGEKAPGDLIERDTAQSARQWTEIAGKVHGWDAKDQAAGVNVAVNIGIIGG